MKKYSKQNIKPNKISLICSEFNKDLVESLYIQACQEFDKYKSWAKESLILFKDGFALKKALDPRYKKPPLWKIIDLLDKEKSSHFLTGPFFKETKKAHLFLKSFAYYIAHLDIETFWVPGAGEIPLAAKWAIERKKADAVLALGAIIRGKTSHYDFLCDLLKNSLWDLQKTYSLPIIFSVLMTENKSQAKERIKKARGAEGIKSLLKMIALNRSLR